jgi:hypothetical protein
MKYIKPFLIILSCFLALVFFPFTIYASQATVHMQPGRVYEFTNNDPRTLAYVTIAGTTRYDFVSIDQHGKAAEFGVSGGRCPVRGGGVTRVSVPSAVSASYNSERISVTITEGAALQRLHFANETYTVENRQTERINLSINIINEDNTYDCVIRDGEKTINFFARQIRFTSQPVPGLGSITFTAGEEGLTLMYPGTWDSAMLHVKKEARPCLVQHELTAGVGQTLINSGLEALSVSVSAGDAFIYDYILRDGRGFNLENFNNARGGRLNVPAGYSLFFTPKNANPILFFPSDWQNDLRLTGGGIGESGLYELEPGQSLALTNTSLTASADIRLQNKQANREFYYDFTVIEGLEIRYGVKRRDATVSLPPGAVFTLTAGENETIEVRLPSDTPITAQRTIGHAVSEYALAPGASVRLGNTHENTLRLTAQSEATAGTLDYLQKDGEGEIVSYGRTAINQSIILEKDSSILVTNTNQIPVSFIFPASWLAIGLTLTESEEDALRFRVIHENQPVLINNIDRQYVCAVKIESETSISAFDFVIHDHNDRVVEYGIFNGGEMEIPNGGKLSVMGQRGVTMVIYYPAEWDDIILKQSDVTDAPLYKATYTPAQRFTLTNRVRGRNAMDYDIQNNSVGTAASYYVRVGDDVRRITAAEQPVSGIITVPRDTSVAITVAAGGDLEIWMPREWARLLIR